MDTMNSSDAVFVAGHHGLVGAAIVRRLRQAGFENLLLRTRSELDLRDPRAVDAFLQETQPAYVFMAAARVGGIHANSTLPADFIRDNLQIQTSLIDGAWRHGVRKLLFLGSSCIYPRLAPQPMKEEHLLAGALEPTNEWYAIAKIAGIKMCQAYRRQYGFNAISAMPTNLYGPGDNFSLENSHVVPALIRKAHEARVTGQERLSVWGSGTPRRELLHVDDLADALLFLMRNYESESLINVGCGTDLTIRELAQMVTETVGFRGSLEFDTSRPDGTPRKLLDVSRLRQLGWTPSIELRAGLEQTYRWYLDNEARLRH
jgi:GDP-L-fucose synthase